MCFAGMAHALLPDNLPSPSVPGASFCPQMPHPYPSLTAALHSLYATDNISINHLPRVPDAL